MNYVEVIHESLNSSYMGQDLALKDLAKWILIFLIFKIFVFYLEFIQTISNCFIPSSTENKVLN